MNTENLGKLCRHKRVAMLLTLEELATASGVTAAELRQIEAGEYVPQNGCRERLARALGIEADRLSTLSEAIPVLPVEPECDKSHLHESYLSLG